MRRARWGCCATSWAFAVALGAAPPAVAQDDLVRITRAELQIGAIARDASICSAKPDPDGRWEPIELPYVHPQDLGARSDGKDYVFLYRARVRPARTGSTAVFIARAYRGSSCLAFNGQPVVDPRWLSSTRWNMPLLFIGPNRKSADEELDLVLASRTRSSAPYVGAFEVGPYPGPVRNRFERQLFLAEGAPQLISVVAVLLGIFALAVWWRRHSERTYLYFALGSLAWAFFLTFCYLSLENLGWSWTWDRVFYNLANSFLLWAIAFLFLFASRFLEFRLRWLEILLIGYSAFLSVSLVALQFAPPGVFATAWRWLIYVTPPLLGLVTIAYVTRFTLRARTREAWLLTSAFWLWLLLGVHDALQGLHWIPIENPVLLPFAALFILLGFGYAILRRYVGSLAAVERSNVELVQRLDQRTRELEASHARLREIEREQALAAERQRLMREMHDGMGSALMSSLALVEQGRLDGAAIAAVLRESIDELKLTIDSLEPIGNDLLTLLATLRYRLGARLERAGLKLQWQVRDLPPLPWLDAGAALQVMRIVQEALTNVVKHARAGAIRVETDSDETSAIVRIVDDGRGFDVAQCLAAGHGGRGLRNMLTRAETLGGQLEFASTPGHTQLTLRLPRQRAPDQDDVTRSTAARSPTGGSAPPGSR
jgi:signal transduction histidine kinase